MKVKDIMSKSPGYCTPDMNLGAAVEILWNRNCGMLPVVDAHGKVLSVITDRDICIALGTRNRLASELSIAEVASQKAVTCTANEDVRSALGKMADAKVRRLPVVSADGKLEGILSTDDVIEQTHVKSSGRGNELTSDDVVGTLKKLFAEQLAQKSATA